MIISSIYSAPLQKTISDHRCISLQNNIRVLYNPTRTPESIPSDIYSCISTHPKDTKFTIFSQDPPLHCIENEVCKRIPRVRDSKGRELCERVPRIAESDLEDGTPA